jgi:hypothetical protein
MREAPREVRLLLGSMELPAASYYPKAVHNTRVTMLIAFYAGPPEEGREVLAPLRDHDNIIMDSLRGRPYTNFQQAGDSQGSMRTYLRSQYVEILSDDVIETLIEYSTDAPSSGATVFVSPWIGAETDPATDATAYPHRNPAHHVLVEARWDDPSRDTEHIDWVRDAHEALAPHTTGDVELNFLTDDEPDERRQSAYGDNYDRLVEVKTKWDPDNLFRTNQTIKHSSQSGMGSKKASRNASAGKQARIGGKETCTHPTDAQSHLGHMGSAGFYECANCGGVIIKW